MKARNVALVMKKDLRGLGRERTIVLAILLQLFVALFSSFLMVGLTSMYDPSSLARFSGVKYPVAYVGEPSDLDELLKKSGQFRVYPMDLSTAVAALGERKLSAVIHVPPTQKDADDPVKITLYSIQNDIQSTIVNVKLKDVFLDYEEELRRVRSERLDLIPVPLEFPESRSGPGFYEFIYGLLIPLLLFMPAVISAALIIDLITEEYQHHTLETLLSTPMTMAEVVWGKITACILIVPLQAGSWLLLLTLNRIPIAHIPQILAQVLSFSLVLVLIGALTALYYRERTAAQFIFSTAVVVLMLIVLAFPHNPLNLIALLATGSPVPKQWSILGGTLILCGLLGILTQLYSEKVSTRAPGE
ncbi:MAG TPA: ABC transporter permease [Methanolinea sp.]|nr:ABC transporter permease [Methanolinea sp.]HQK56849.1 ABC transporter permease [Methanolinea sp.]